MLELLENNLFLYSLQLFHALVSFGVSDLFRSWPGHWKGRVGTCASQMVGWMELHIETIAWFLALSTVISVWQRQVTTGVATDGREGQIEISVICWRSKEQARYVRMYHAQTVGNERAEASDAQKSLRIGLQNV